ncbi:MAG: phosphopantetheine adenylyltransferase [Methanobrevibacter sp.]|jgi:pantetheine-phosphate adenylyltransferase|nr:phosphopantetheine adenylyltransferase [Candidatus Methanovirga basalitermitum]
MFEKKYYKVAVGGTFDRFHHGHRKLLETAFEIGNNVVIGVTSTEFAQVKGNVEPCSIRMFNLNEFLSKCNNVNFSIFKLDDSFGSTIFDEDFDAIVVSEETEPTAVKINEIREQKNMDQLAIFVISYVVADDGIPISSTRIRKGEIDIKGRIIK